MPPIERLPRIEAPKRATTNDDVAPLLPDWHKAALKKAEQALAGGEAQFIDWTTAKDILRKGNAT
jgi:hypothetical protein